MIIGESIDYVEVSVFDGDVETSGLLTYFGTTSKRLSAITSSDTTEVFDLKMYSITRIIVGKYSKEYDIEEQYVFKNTEEDQEIAQTVVTNQIKLLEAEGRATKSGFLTKDTYVNVPEKYKKDDNKLSAASIIRNKRAATLGGTVVKVPQQQQTGQKPVYNNYNNNYQKRNTKTVDFVPRASKLPSKAFLKTMKAKVKAVASGKFNTPLPEILDIDEADSRVNRLPTQAEIDDAYADMYGDGMYHNHEGYYD